MTFHVEIAPRANRDFRLLFLSIQADDSEAAARWFNGLEAAVSSLAECPERCPVAPESAGFNRVLRHLLYGHKPDVYRVLYEIDRSRGAVIVLHIRHGAMRPLSPGEVGRL